MIGKVRKIRADARGNTIVALRGDGGTIAVDCYFANGTDNAVIDFIATLSVRDAVDVIGAWMDR